jgi:hypothetical protein
MARVQPAATTAEFLSAGLAFALDGPADPLAWPGTGKLRIGAEQTICRVHNVSVRGFIADSCPAPAPGSLVVLELTEGRRLAAKVAWSQGDRFGAEFASRQEAAQRLARPARSARFRSRAVRIEPAAAFATIFEGERPHHTSILNISQTGMAVCGADLSLDRRSSRRLRLEIDGLGAMDGLLCWAAGGRAGIRFAEPLGFERLGHWLWACALAARQLALRA